MGQQHQVSIGLSEKRTRKALQIDDRSNGPFYNVADGPNSVLEFPHHQ